MGKEKIHIDNTNDMMKRIFRFTIIIILIIFILLMRSCTGIDKINDLVPTGNIDIFDIIIDNNCCKEKECECNCKNGDEPTFKEEEEADRTLIYDNNGEYENSNNLNIFSNPAYEFKSIIAPTSTNVYQFVVRNNNDFNIKYNIKMNEINEFNINMKYRLKLDGKYVKGSETKWVTYDELHFEDLKLADKSKNVYQLEWKWFESENDVHIGEIGDYYSLKISFDGEEI